MNRGKKAVYTHGNHRLELLWTAVPAAILLFIAFVQISAWERIKYRSRMPSPDLTLTVTARQWEWRMRYPGDPARFHAEDKEESDKLQGQARFWAENPEADDVHIPNEIHCWRGAHVKMWVRTQDVIHSLTIPNLRLKQDALPGKTIPMWFRPTRHNCHFEPSVTFDKNNNPVPPHVVDSPNKADHWEIACQELCGGRHYAMRGRLYVHKDEKDFRAWLNHARRQQQNTNPTAGTSAGP